MSTRRSQVDQLAERVKKRKTFEWGCLWADEIFLTLRNKDREQV